MSNFSLLQIILFLWIFNIDIGLTTPGFPVPTKLLDPPKPPDPTGLPPPKTQLPTVLPYPIEPSPPESALLTELLDHAESHLPEELPNPAETPADHPNGQIHRRAAMLHNPAVSALPQYPPDFEESIPSREFPDFAERYLPLDLPDHTAELSDPTAEYPDFAEPYLPLDLPTDRAKFSGHSTEYPKELSDLGKSSLPKELTDSIEVPDSEDPLLPLHPLEHEETTIKAADNTAVSPQKALCMEWERGSKVHLQGDRWTCIDGCNICLCLEDGHVAKTNNKCSAPNLTPVPVPTNASIHATTYAPTAAITPAPTPTPSSMPAPTPEAPQGQPTQGLPHSPAEQSQLPQGQPPADVGAEWSSWSKCLRNGHRRIRRRRCLRNSHSKGSNCTGRRTRLCHHKPHTLGVTGHKHKLNPQKMRQGRPIRSGLFKNGECFQDCIGGRREMHGCGRLLEGYLSDDFVMTVENCIYVCKNRGFKYAGLEQGTLCGCGDKIPAGHIKSGECKMPCFGNKKQICGGSNRINIYRTKGVSRYTHDFNSTRRKPKRGLRSAGVSRYKHDFNSTRRKPKRGLRSAARYKKMEDGQLCSGTWFQIITEADCKAAAYVLRLKWTNSWKGNGDFPGCIHANDERNSVYFNLSPLPSNVANNPKYAAICKGDRVIQEEAFTDQPQLPLEQTTEQLLPEGGEAKDVSNTESNGKTSKAGGDEKGSENNKAEKGCRYHGGDPCGIKDGIRRDGRISLSDENEHGP